jgi:hypothetical protein
MSYTNDTTNTATYSQNRKPIPDKATFETVSNYTMEDTDQKWSELTNYTNDSI